MINHSVRITIASIIILMISIQTGNGQFIQTNGPCGGLVPSMIKKDNYIFAGTENGIFRSSDWGVTWKKNEQYGEVGPFFLEGNRIYAPTYSSGVFFSDNNGDDWFKISWSANNGDIISAAAIGDTLFIGAKTGSFYSTDKSISWSRARGELSDLLIYSFIVKNKVLFAGTEYGKVFKTMDRGATWLKADSGLIGNSRILAFAEKGEHLYLATFFNGIFRSTDSGSSWMQLAKGLTNNELYVRSMVIEGNHIYSATLGGLFRSNTDSTNWNKLSDHQFCSISIKGDTILGGTYDEGIY